MSDKEHTGITLRFDLSDTQGLHHAESTFVPNDVVDSKNFRLDDVLNICLRYGLRDFMEKIKGRIRVSAEQDGRFIGHCIPYSRGEDNWWDEEDESEIRIDLPSGLRTGHE